jgi:hypothetical protein
MPVTGREDPQGCETSRLLHFLDNRPTIEIKSISGAQLSRCLLPPSPEDGNRSSFRNVVFSIL